MKAHETLYKSTRFRSRLEARWAAFFDLVGWGWKYEPVDLEGWSPDFLVTFADPWDGVVDSLYVEVKPYLSIAEFQGHPATKIEPYSNPSPAMFGQNPDITRWEMASGDSAGRTTVADCINDGTSGYPAAESFIQNLWEQAGNITRYHVEATE